MTPPASGVGQAVGGHPHLTTTRRTVFLDVDGTYADHGVVPPGHQTAVRSARAAGHRVFLCTGRSRAMLSPHVLAAGFDGVVAGGGSYVEVGGRVLLDRRFPRPLATRVLSVLGAHEAAFLLEAPEGQYGPPGVDACLRALLHRHAAGVDAARGGPMEELEVLEIPNDLSRIAFAKVSVFDSPVPVSELAAMIGDGVGALPSSLPGMGPSAGEIHLTGVHKALGMEIVARHVGVRREDVVAFGDGLNDLEMLEFAGTGVAVEGADPRVLKVAGRVALGPRQAGLVQAFAELGLT